MRAMAKFMGNICREVQLVPPMTAAMHRGYARWSRCLRVSTDIVAKRRRVEAAEAHMAPFAHGSRGRMGQVDTDLAHG